MNCVFENSKNIALGYFGNACVYFELNKYVLQTTTNRKLISKLYVQ